QRHDRRPGGRHGGAAGGGRDARHSGVGMTTRGTGARADVAGFGIEQSQLPPFEAGRIDPRLWFDHRHRRFEIEVGSGKGTFLVQEAPQHGEVNYLGIEKSPEYWRFAADRVRRHGLANVRILRADAVEFLRYWCADGVASVVHLYFSDPWPKTRHHKRRV